MSVNQLLVVDAVAQNEFIAIPPKSRICEVPPLLQLQHCVNGGNIMCGNDVPNEGSFVGLYSFLVCPLHVMLCSLNLFHPQQSN
ncbi:hypothetical protein THRCLA_23448 [Thraustotheca clavata]|uniref:Uncharacterized protein n=1 Tax=Thraustotheca clavata TaxID=74557 RepID=A0A1V9Y4H5_9STRA|nr:hypothetical protein THRCLA_23448 [Thraustotheca clavata]